MFKSLVSVFSSTKPIAARRLLTASLLLLAASASSPRAAQAFDPTRGGVSPVPSNRWGLLQPEAILSDQTRFNFESQIGSSNPFFLGVDVENGWVFGSTGRGLVLYDARTTPGNPVKKPTFFASTSNVPNWEVNDLKFYTFGVDAPPGDDTVAALAVINSNGMFIFDTSNKEQAPVLKYQDNNKSGKEVWATTFSNTNYAFFASDKGTMIYNMSAAKNLAARCLDSTPTTATCRDPQNRPVYVGKIATSSDYLSGAGNYLALSRGFLGVELWRVSDPGQPAKVGSFVPPGITAGLAMWQERSSYYLATVQLANSAPRVLNIYDVSCMVSSPGSCSGTLVKSYPMNHAAPTSMLFVTFSRAGSTPFLYVGSEDQFSGTPQREYLLDVSNPSNPVDITPTNNADGYWGWYYFGNPTGFNWVMPRNGKFYNNYFYRAAYSLFDVHQYIGNLPPTAAFSYAPSTVYAGDAVTFTDRSTGTVTSRSWTFSPDGSPSTSTLADPAVAFSAQGQKTVTLTINGNGDSETQNLTVYDPTPRIETISLVPAAPKVCQRVTFSGVNVTGKPPLSYSWQILETNGSALIPSAGGTGTTFNWDTANRLAQDYLVRLTVTGPQERTASKDVQFTLSNLGSLPSPNTFTPTAELNGLAVTFRLPATPAELANASEWSWDFGDGQGWSAWDANPTTGPNPTHNYATTGQYSAKVRVRNCLGPVDGIVSNTVAVDVRINVVAKFQPVCFGGLCVFSTTDPVSFIDQSIGAQTWDYDWNADGTFEDAGHTSPVTTHTFSTPGKYRPKLRVNPAGGGNPVIYQVPVEQELTIQQGGPPPTPSIRVSGPSSATPGQNVTFTASASNCSPSTSGWTWETDGGTGTSTTSSITLSWSANGSKTVRASNSGCGTAKGSTSITISTGNPPPPNGLKAIFTYAPVPVFANQTISFDGSGSTGSPTSYLWSFGDGSASVSGSKVTHTFTKAGPYTVKLSVAGPGSCPPAPFCESESQQTVVVTDSKPVLAASFASDICNLGLCQAEWNKEVTFVDTSSGNVVSRTWDFGDGTTATGTTVTHAYKKAGNWVLTLTVTDGASSNTIQRTVSVSGGPVTEEMVLPWIAKTSGVLVQSSDFYLHNPGVESIDVTLTFRQRGTPEDNPPKATRTIGANATLVVSDVVKSLFGRDNISGFVHITVDRGATQPVVMSFNTTVQKDGSEFGQTIPGYLLSNTGAASTTGNKQLQHLVGLNDNQERLSYFGLSNSSNNPATYRLRFFDTAGHEIGTGSQAIVLPPNGFKQYQSKDVRTLFGIADQDDYRVMVETDQGAPVFPYGANVRKASDDPSFVSVGTAASRVFLVGALSTPGAKNSIWQSDLVIANTGNQVAIVDITFNNVGLTSPATDTIHETLQPGETRRLVDVIGTKWNIRNGVGVLTIDSNVPGDLFPIVQGESYENTNPAKRFGQTLPALTDKQAAGAGQGQYLVGLRQDAKYRTTFWVFNPGPDSAEYEIVFRSLEGAELGRVTRFTVGAGKARQFNQAQFPANLNGGFTAQVLVRSGKALTAAQVVNNATNDPAYIQGETR